MFINFIFDVQFYNNAKAVWAIKILLNGFKSIHYLTEEFTKQSSNRKLWTLVLLTSLYHSIEHSVKRVKKTVDNYKCD